MKFIVAAATLFATALAVPAVVERQYTPCSGLYGTAQCCAVDVLGVADLDCANPPSGPPTSAAEFQSDCSAIGQQARCCAIPILDQDVLCETPAGINEG